jgi:hypothetical protein
MTTLQIAVRQYFQVEIDSDSRSPILPFFVPKRKRSDNEF